MFDNVMLVFVCVGCDGLHRCNFLIGTKCLDRDYFDANEKFLLSCANQQVALEFMRKLAPHFHSLDKKDRDAFYLGNGLIHTLTPYIESMYQFVIAEAKRQQQLGLIDVGELCKPVNSNEQSVNQHLADLLVENLVDKLTGQLTKLQKHIQTDNEKQYLADPAGYYRTLVLRLEQERKEAAQRNTAKTAARTAARQDARSKLELELGKKVALTTSVLAASCLLLRYSQSSSTLVVVGLGATAAVIWLKSGLSDLFRKHSMVR